MTREQMIDEAVRAWHAWSHFWPEPIMESCPCNRCEANRVNLYGPVRSGILTEFRRIVAREQQKAALEAAKHQPEIELRSWWGELAYG